MALAQTLSSPFIPLRMPLKRSFSQDSAAEANPAPAKIARRTAMVLRRTESYLSLPALVTAATGQNVPPPPTLTLPAAPAAMSPSLQPSTKRGCRYHREQQAKRKALTRQYWTQLDGITLTAQLDITQSPSPVSSSHRSPSPAPLPTKAASPRVRTPTSPLSLFCFSLTSTASTTAPPSNPLLPYVKNPPAPPTRVRPSFPKSKVEPNLFKQAVTARLRATPDGKKILRMGPRLALDLVRATSELERIVAGRLGDDMDVDVDMSVNMSHPWVVVQDRGQHPQSEDWEMVAADL